MKRSFGQGVIRMGCVDRDELQFVYSLCDEMLYQISIWQEGHKELDLEYIMAPFFYSKYDADTLSLTGQEIHKKYPWSPLGSVVTVSELVAECGRNRMPNNAGRDFVVALIRISVHHSIAQRDGSNLFNEAEKRVLDELGISVHSDNPGPVQDSLQAVANKTKEKEIMTEIAASMVVSKKARVVLLRNPGLNRAGPCKMDGEQLVKLTKTDGKIRNQPDREKRLNIVLELGMLLHGRRCRAARNEGNCNIKDCGGVMEILAHMDVCDEGKSCKYPRCSASRLALEHWQGCTREKNCSMCAPIRQHCPFGSFLLDPRCSASRLALEHWQGCTRENCSMCAPIRQLLLWFVFMWPSLLCFATCSGALAGMHSGELQHVRADQTALLLWYRIESLRSICNPSRLALEHWQGCTRENCSMCAPMHCSNFIPLPSEELQTSRSGQTSAAHSGSNEEGQDQSVNLDSGLARDFPKLLVLKDPIKSDKTGGRDAKQLDRSSGSAPSAEALKKAPPQYPTGIRAGTTEFKAGRHRLAAEIWLRILEDPDFTISRQTDNWENVELNIFAALALTKRSDFDYEEACKAKLRLDVAKILSDDAVLPFYNYVSGSIAAISHEYDVATAESTALRQILDNGCKFRQLCYPGTKTVFEQSARAGLLELATELENALKNQKPPNFVCCYDPCENPAIYYDFNFKGYLDLECTSGCHAILHPLCFEEVRVDMGLTEASDIENVSAPCAANCGSTISSISVYKKDSLLKAKYSYKPQAATGAAAERAATAAPQSPGPSVGTAAPNPPVVSGGPVALPEVDFPQFRACLREDYRDD